MWVVQDRPELRIVDETLWQAAHARLALMTERFGDGRHGRPGGAAHVAYSPQLLAGVLRCGLCGARMHATKFTRRKGPRTYTYHRYVCGFAKDGPPALGAAADWEGCRSLARRRRIRTLRPVDAHRVLKAEPEHLAQVLPLPPT
jgi:hypothetical protein